MISSSGCRKFQEHFTLHKKCSFPLRISTVNVIKSAISCWFGQIYWRNPLTKYFIFCAVLEVLLGPSNRSIPHPQPSRHLIVQSQQLKHKNMCEICSKLKTPEWRHWRQWRRSCFFIVNFEQISYIVLVFLLLTLNTKCRLGRYSSSLYNMREVSCHPTNLNYNSGMYALENTR